MQTNMKSCILPNDTLPQKAQRTCAFIFNHFDDDCIL